MREAIGGISIFQIVILFILLFTGIMCLTINHSKAFSVKDDIINLIQNNKYTINKNGEIDTNVTAKISEILSDSGYRVTGNCPTSSDNNVPKYLGFDRDGNITTGRAAYCIRVNNVSKIYNIDIDEICSNNKCESTIDDFPDMVYYDVVLFYQLDIPIISSFLNFELKGTTRTVMR